MNENKAIYDLGIDQNFLKHDMQLNQNVIINGRNAYNSFAADLIDYTFTAPEVSKTLYRNLGGSSFNINTFSLGDSFLTLNFYVGGTSLTNAQINTNHLLDEFTNRVAIVKLDETNFEYECVIDTHTVEYTGVKCYYLVSITANAIKRLPLKTAVFSRTSSRVAGRLVDGEVNTLRVYNEGVTCSGVRIELKTSSWYPEYVVNPCPVDITYKNDKGEDVALHFETLFIEGGPDHQTSYLVPDTYFTIDGIDCDVRRRKRFYLGNQEYEEHEENALLDVNIIDFPFFHNGLNEITVAVDSGNDRMFDEIIISFYPRFII